MTKSRASAKAKVLIGKNATTSIRHVSEDAKHEPERFKGKVVYRIGKMMFLAGMPFANHILGEGLSWEEAFTDFEQKHPNYII